jgi:hypothetical protein
MPGISQENLHSIFTVEEARWEREIRLGWLSVVFSPDSIYILVSYLGLFSNENLTF